MPNSSTSSYLRVIGSDFGLQFLYDIVGLEDVVGHGLDAGVSPLDLTLFVLQRLLKMPGIGISSGPWTRNTILG